MDMVFYSIGFFIGLAFLYFGAEGLVSGASSMALRFGIAPLIVGLTIVAFGTSAPELLVSLLAIAKQKDGISVGNIIGSNIANIALILGCAALVRPIEVTKEAVNKQYPLMLMASVLLVALCHMPPLLSMGLNEVALRAQYTLDRLDGAILLACMVLFLMLSFWQGRSKKEQGGLDELEELEDVDPSASTTLHDMSYVVAGVVALAIGAFFLVEGAVYFAKMMHVPDLVIGITVVAIGTSLPELATSVVAAHRGESDISVGNVIGSNIFNIFLVLGLVAIILPIQVNPDAVHIDLWVMLGISIIIWPVMRSGLRIGRLEGTLLLLGYAGYMMYLFIR